MATAIKNFYLEEFVPSYQSASGRLIDISKLVEENKNWTPIPLPYSNKTQSVMNLSAAIIVNICRTYHNTTLLPKKAFELITELITASTDNPDVVAKQIFLTHITKRIMNVEVFSFHVVRNNCMKIKNVLFDDERKWVELAEKVMSHRQINGKIDECLADFGQPVHELTDIEYEQTKVKVTLVESAAAMVRGFAGFHEIFINADHFRQKIDNFKGDTHLLQLVAKIDIISVVLHEYGHIKIRQSNGDFNMHSPIVGQLSGLPAIKHEFGIYAEKKIFGQQIDWFLSYDNMDIPFVESFVGAIENNSSLPLGFVEGVVPRDGDPFVIGADVQHRDYIC